MNTKTIWLGALAISALFLFQSYQLIEVYDMKILSQKRINTQAEQVKTKFNGLQPVRQSWESTFPDAKKVNDLVTLYRELGLKKIGLQAEANNLYDSGRTLFDHEGESHGLVKACLANDPSGMVVLAQSIRGALTGLAAMESNPSIRFEGLTIDQHEGKVRLTFPELCVLLRGA